MKPLLTLLAIAALLTLLSLTCHAQVTANKLAPSTFSNLGSPADSSVRYCTNCSKTTPCTGGGTGADAFRVNGVWECAAGGGGGDVDSIIGTANQVIVNHPTGDVTLSLPQSIATTSNVAFNTVGTTNDLTVGGSAAVTGTVSGSHLFMTNFLRGSEVAAPSVSASGTARLYPDSTSHTWKASSNGGGYFNLLTGATNLTTNNLPVATAVNQLGNGFFAQAGDAPNPVLNFGAADNTHVRLRDGGGSLQVQRGDGTDAAVLNVNSIATTGAVTIGDTVTTTHLFTTTGFIRMQEIAAPSVSSSGTARMYADSGFHTMRLSVNGGAYASIVLSSRQVSTTLPLAGGSSLSGDISLTCPTCAVVSGNLGNAALVAGTGGAKSLNTPSTTATLDASGNIATRGTVQSGAAGVTTGALKVAGSTSGVVTIQAQDTAGTWTLKPPAAAGTTGQVLQASNDTGTTQWETAETVLSTTTSVNMNTATATTLYTCPTGKACLVTRVIVRAASTSLTTASYSFGWNSAAFNDVVANATHTEITSNTVYTTLQAKTGATLGAGLGTFRVLMNTLQGGAATTTISVVGIIF